MRVVVALGGNALLRRGEPMTPKAQLANVRIAATALADLARDHRIVVTHGNGPQVGLMALQVAAHAPGTPWPLDVLGAETEGMIGYLIEQELMNAMPQGSACATLLSRVEVDASDPAFAHPTKPIGPVYDAEAAARARDAFGWSMMEEAPGAWRRVVPSPLPRAILGIPAIRLLVEADHVVICAGGGGIPVARMPGGRMEGVEAVIDKDRTAAALALALDADALLMLTDVEAVFRDWGSPAQTRIATVLPDVLDLMDLPPGSMGPKAASAAAFARAGGVAGIGRLQDARAILEGGSGTRVRLDGASPAPVSPLPLSTSCSEGPLA